MNYSPCNWGMMGLWQDVLSVSLVEILSCRLCVAVNCQIGRKSTPSCWSCYSMGRKRPSGRGWSTRYTTSNRTGSFSQVTECSIRPYSITLCIMFVMIPKFTPSHYDLILGSPYPKCTTVLNTELISTGHCFCYSATVNTLDASWCHFFLHYIYLFFRCNNIDICYLGKQWKHIIRITLTFDIL